MPIPVKRMTAAKMRKMFSVILCSFICVIASLREAISTKNARLLQAESHRPRNDMNVILLNQPRQQSPCLLHIITILIAKIFHHQRLFKANAGGNIKNGHACPGEPDEPVG